MAVAVSAELVLAVRALRLRGAVPRGAGRPRRCSRPPTRAWTPTWPTGPLSGDLEAARQLLFDDALWMESERDELP